MINDREDVRYLLTEDAVMNVVDSQLIDVAGKLISSIVSMFIVFRYFDQRYIRTYNNKWIYMLLMVGGCLLNLGTTILGIPIANVVVWLVMVSLIGKLFYYDEDLEKGKYYIINIVFILAVSTCEAIGGVLLMIVAKFLNIQQSMPIMSFMSMVGGAVSVVILFYLILNRLFIRKKVQHILMSQYAIYVIITTYVLVNIGEILFFMQHELNNMDSIFLILDSVFIVFVNLYLFYLLDTFAENRDLKYKVALYERQAQRNYEYYAKQEEWYKLALSVNHDIRKHIKIISGLNEKGAISEMTDYVSKFDDMLSPLLKNKFCENVILNIIVNDKMDYCQKHNIKFDVSIYEINIEFVKPIDMTTIFGNILDNAIEASEKAVEKRISLKIRPFNGFIYVQLINTFEGKVVLNAKGHPISKRGEQHGIGLENVEKALKKYNGNMKISTNDNEFMMELIFNRA